MFGEINPKMLGKINYGEFNFPSLSLTGNTPSYNTPTNILNVVGNVQFSSGYVKSANNTLDDGSGGFSLATSGSAAGNIGTGTYTGQITIGNTSNNLGLLVQGGVGSNAALTINSTSGGGCYMYVNRSGSNNVAFGSAGAAKPIDIYDFGATSSWLYNNGTHGFVGSAHNTLDDGSGAMIISSTANATSPSTGALNFSGSSLSIGRAGSALIGIPTELNFGTAYSQRMICLYDGGSAGTQDQNQFYGLGITSGVLHYSVGPGGSHKFYAGTSSIASNLLFTIQSNGVVSTTSNTLDDGVGTITAGFRIFSKGYSVAHMTDGFYLNDGTGVGGTDYLSITSDTHGSLAITNQTGTPLKSLYIDGTGGGVYAPGFLYESIFSANYSTTTTLAAHDCNKGVIVVPAGTGAITLTFPTGTNLSSEFFNGVIAGVSPFNNQSKRLMIVNQSANTVTVATNTGITLTTSKNTIAATTVANFILQNTGTNTFTIYGGN